MKLAVVLPALATGGAERQTVQLVRGLARREHEVSLVTLVPGGPGWDRLASEERVRVRALFPDEQAGTGRAAGLKRLARAVPRLRAALLEAAPDLVYACLYVADLGAWRAVRGLPRPTPLVWGLRATRLEGDWRRRVLVRLCARASRGVALCIANSRAGLADHRAAGFRPRAEAVVPNGIDTTLFHFDAASRARVRADWHVEPHERLVGLVGRLDPMKDHATFLEAAARLARARGGVRFVVVGASAGGTRHGLEAVARSLGLERALVWDGVRLDVPAVLSALDVLCSSSAYGEGFSNVLGEAMACGVPCVATDVGDARLILGDDARIVPPRAAAQLAETIGRVLDDPAVRVPDPRLRARVEAQFGVEASVTAMERLFEEVRGG